MAMIFAFKSHVLKTVLSAFILVKALSCVSFLEEGEVLYGNTDPLLMPDLNLMEFFVYGPGAKPLSYGDSIYPYMLIANMGYVDVDTVGISIHMVSEDDTTGPRIPIAYSQLSGLIRGETNAKPLTFPEYTITEVIEPGHYLVIAKIDNEDIYQEYNEANNERIRLITIDFNENPP